MFNKVDQQLRRNILTSLMMGILTLLVVSCNQEPSRQENKDKRNQSLSNAIERGKTVPIASSSSDLILINGQIYSFAWDEPSVDGGPAKNAPVQDGIWSPEFEAVGIRDGRIVSLGTNEEVLAGASASTKVIDLKGGVVFPGFVDSHFHVAELGELLHRVDLTQVSNASDAVAKVREYAKQVSPGEWIIGQGWDEGAWANSHPNRQMLDEFVPDNPVVLKSLHGFAVWANTSALRKTGISKLTQPPVGGEILTSEDGEPTGVLLNRATQLVLDKVPAPSKTQFQEFVASGLHKLAKSGYVSVHQAGANSRHLEAFQSLEKNNQLAIRVYAMLSARDTELSNSWLKQGPYADPDGWLDVRAVKAYYDGALGSRGARLLDEYSDRPGHRGVSGDGYGFDGELVKRMIAAGFQVGIHAIGDAGNRETLEYLEQVFAEHPTAVDNRHRIEHAQVIHPRDIRRFPQMSLIASMEPPHAVEDKTWVEERLGGERVLTAYAWRSLRKAGTHVIFNSDGPGSDHSLFYGLYAAITRKDKSGTPENGWYRQQAFTAEEAIRAYTTWAAYSAFRENETGLLSVGRWADMTVLSLDPLNLGATNPEALLSGEVLMTVVDGQIKYSSWHQK